MRRKLLSNKHLETKNTCGCEFGSAFAVCQAVIQFVSGSLPQRRVRPAPMTTPDHRGLEFEVAQH